ncbi:MAG: phospholipase D family protein [Opitutaceae bacterium]|nr:phospholipase D family protein [Cephaloticoccus sp.]MCP5529804.1 phospholipase D family protein [Opitutaceae bacterium]
MKIWRILGLLALVWTGVARAEGFADSPFGPVSLADPADPTAGNRVVSIENGRDALLVRLHLIRQARASIDIQTFIWTDDECGRLLMYELIEAARRGVRVRIIADHMVSDQDPRTVAFLATVHPNFQVRHYRPAMRRINPSLWQTMLAGALSFHGTNQRMHNKLMVFDGAIMLTGGRNIENTYFDHSRTMNFRDRDVLAVGPVAQVAADSFEEFWNFKHTVPGTELTDVAAIIAADKYPRYESRADYDFGVFFADEAALTGEVAAAATRLGGQLRLVAKVRFIVDLPGKSSGWFARDSLITRKLRALAAGAERDIVMQTPYLILSKPARRLVKELQRKNPDMRIRISSNSFASTDNLLAYSANYRLRGVYVRDLGLEIHEFKPQPESLRELFPDYDAMADLAAAEQPRNPAKPFLCIHAKSLVVDDRVSFVGSYNLDPRSENLNTEVGLVIEDELFARELRAAIEADMQPENSWVIGKRDLPLPVGMVNALIDGIISHTPLDVWPVQNTTSYELRPDKAELPLGHPDFHRHYRDAGPFPGTDGLLSTKEILTRIYKAVGSPLTPIL